MLALAYHPTPHPSLPTLGVRRTACLPSTLC